MICKYFVKNFSSIFACYNKNMKKESRQENSGEEYIPFVLLYFC
ncbi:hypothetical protein V6Z12_D11G249800 [Gossypium hirsutum]